jgi:streptogrisin D
VVVRHPRLRAAIALLSSLLLPLGGAHASSTGTPSGGDAPEIIASQVQDVALANGALGVYLGQEGVVVVMPEDAPADARAFVPFEGRIRITIRTVAVTKADIDAVKDLAASTHEARGGRWAVWFDPVRGSIVVEGPPDASLDSVLSERFEGKVIRQRSEIVFERLLGRDDDSPAFWGGARIQDEPFRSRCSSGFSVARGGTSYMLTAGHCWDLNRRVVTPQGVFVGMVRLRAPFPKTD